MLEHLEDPQVATVKLNLHDAYHPRAEQWDE
jgi:hypothetical protein